MALRFYPQLSILYPQKALAVAGAALAGFVALLFGLHPHLKDIFSVPELKDLVMLGGGVFLAFVAVIGLAFRAPQAALAGVLTLGVSVAGTCVVMSLTDAPDALLIPVLVFIMALATVYTLYTGSSFPAEVYFEKTNRRGIRDHRYVLSEGLRKVRDGVLLSMGLLAVGFLSLRFSSVPMFGKFGFVLAAGTVLTAIASLTIMPATLALWPGILQEKPALGIGFLNNIAKSATTRGPLHLGIGGVIAVVGIIGVLKLDVAGSDKMVSALLTALVIACVAIVVLMVLMFRRFNLALVAFACSIVPFLAGAGVVGLMGKKIDPTLVVMGGIMLGLCIVGTMILFVGYLGRRKYFTPNNEQALLETFGDAAWPVLFGSVALLLGFGIIELSSHKPIHELGVVLSSMVAATAVMHLFVTPAVLAKTSHVKPTPTQKEIDILGKFKKLRADQLRNSFDDYNDEEVLSLFTGDFLALAGKKVIRQGGHFGTRRMFYELGIKPGMKVLEIGTGVGASAFDIVAHNDVHVTTVDLSAYMVGVAQGLVKELGLEDKITVMHVTDGDHFPFEDNSFDLILTEAIVMYADPDAIFSETYRLLKPGGRIGFHDWSWPQRPDKQFEELTCILACGCNIGDIRIQSKDEWVDLMKRQNIQPAFAEEFPFKFFAMTGLRDDEGSWGLIKMVARVFKRKATIHRFMRMVLFLGKYDGAFTYTIIVGEKKEGAPLPKAVEPENKQLPESSTAAPAPAPV